MEWTHAVSHLSPFPTTHTEYHQPTYKSSKINENGESYAKNDSTIFTNSNFYLISKRDLIEVWQNSMVENNNKFKSLNS